MEDGTTVTTTYTLDVATPLTMVLAEKTVSNYISSIFNKLQVIERAQAIVRARQAGMGRDEI